MKALRLSLTGALAVLALTAHPVSAQLTLPYSGSASSASSIFSITNPSGNAIRGTSAAGPGLIGISGTDPTTWYESRPIGVLGASSTSIGVFGLSAGTCCAGVAGQNTATGGGYGVEAVGNWMALYAHGTGSAVYGLSGASSGIAPGGSTAVGVFGDSSTTDGVLGTSSADAHAGVVGRTTSAAGYGVLGRNSATASNAVAVKGVIDSTTPGSGSVGVRGINNGTSAYGYGVWGSHAGTGVGVYATTSGTGKALLAYAPAPGVAGYFSGDVFVSGTLAKSGGSFKIDHPVDPANKYLSHSFVESPDMKNIYDGVATTDASGGAVVVLPDWFGALNQDFRYQLTVIGQFAQAIVARKIEGNRFAIRTDKPNVEVSWQVTGIRKDAWAQANRIPVEQLKTREERGRYLHPELFGQPADKSLVEVPHLDRSPEVEVR